SALVLRAGGLGVPGFVALASNADWRWGAAGEVSPWFPTFRLFRQRRPGDWEELFQRMAMALAARASGQAEAAPGKPAVAAAKPKHVAKRPARKSAAKPGTEAAEPKPASAVPAPPPVPPPVPPKPLHIPGIIPDAKPPAAPEPGKSWPAADRRASYVAVRAPESSGAPGMDRRASYAPVSEPPRQPTPASAPPPAPEPAPPPASEPEPMPELPAQLKAILDELTRRGGHQAAMRRFLDRHLKPREVVIVVGVGDGLVPLAAAARHPGRVNVIALDADASRLEALRQAADSAGMAQAIEALRVAAGARPTPGRSDSPAVATLDGVMEDRPDMRRRQIFLCLDSDGREPEIVAGALELIARGRIAAVLWRRSKVYDEGPGAKRLERLLEDLSGLGFRHCRIADGDEAAELAPYDGKSPATAIASLPRSFALR
ncbi:MAG: hypothetical protein ACT4N4_07070, partial [Rhodospirillales bacterium]